VPDDARVEVHGYDELAAGSRTLFKRIGEEASKRFEGVADDAASAVRARVPVISGAMASSVASGRVDEGASVGYDGSVVYAGWVDYGGGHGRPYIGSGRYFWPVAGQAQSRLVDVGERAATDEIRRMHWPSPST